VGLVDKITLRSIVAIIAISTLVFIVLYLFIRSDIRVTVSGTLDIAQVLTTFLTLIGVVMGWLFGRQDTR